MVVLGMANHGLNGRASLEQLAQLWSEISPACNVNCDSFGMIALPAKALINKRFFRPDSRQALDLCEGGFQRHSIIGIIVGGIDSHNPALSRGGNDRHFAAKLVVLVDFALRDTFDFWGMDTIDFPIVLSR